MAKTTAAEFARKMKRYWDDPDEEHNANVVAAWFGGKAKRRAITPNHWYKTIGDAPGTLYQFPDGSGYVVGNDGHWIASPSLRVVSA